MPNSKSRGSVLVVSLLMLVVLTLLAISAINSGTINLRIIGNMQAQTRAQLATQQAIEQYLSNVGNFTTPTAQTITVSGLDVNLSAPICRRTEAATGYSAGWALVPEENEWEFTATVADPDTGAQAQIVQGVRIRMTAGSCP